MSIAKIVGQVTRLLCLALLLRLVDAQGKASGGAAQPNNNPKAAANLVCGVKGNHDPNKRSFYMGNFFFNAPDSFGLCADFCKADTQKCKGFRYSYFSDSGGQYCEFFNAQMGDAFTADNNSEYWYYDIACAGFPTFFVPSPAGTVTRTVNQVSTVTATITQAARTLTSVSISLRTITSTVTTTKITVRTLARVTSWRTATVVRTVRAPGARIVRHIQTPAPVPAAPTPT